jgi:hypothetical protein
MYAARAVGIHHRRIDEIATALDRLIFTLDSRIKCEMQFLSHYNINPSAVKQIRRLPLKNWLELRKSIVDPPLAEENQSNSLQAGISASVC